MGHAIEHYADAGMPIAESTSGRRVDDIEGMQEESDGLAGVAANTQNAPWQVLSALASEYAHAVRHPNGISQTLQSAGSVQQELQASIAPGDPGGGSSDHKVKSDLSDVSDTARLEADPLAPSHSNPNMQAVQQEAARDSAKFLSADHASTQVVQRFDFMKSRDTRVNFGSECCVSAQLSRLCHVPGFVCSTGGSFPDSAHQHPGAGCSLHRVLKKLCKQGTFANQMLQSPTAQPLPYAKIRPLFTA